LSLCWRQIENKRPLARPRTVGTQVNRLFHQPLNGAKLGGVFVVLRLPRQRRSDRQRHARFRGVLFVKMRVLGFLHPGNRIQRQAKAHRRVAGHQIHSFGTERPRAAHPLACAIRIVFTAQWQRVAYDFFEALLEHARQARAIFRIVEIVLKRIDIYREPPFLPQVVPRVFVSRLDVRRIHIETFRQ